MKRNNLIGALSTFTGLSLMALSDILSLSSFLNNLGFLLFFIGVDIFIFIKWNAFNKTDKIIASTTVLITFITFVNSVMNSLKYTNFAIVTLFCLLGYLYHKYIMSKPSIK